MRATFVWTLLAAFSVMAVLGVLRFPFALRFWVRMRRLGYLYVVFIVLLAVLSLVTGLRL